jgi:hypothetical protein
MIVAFFATDRCLMAQSELSIDGRSAVVKTDPPCFDNTSRFANCGNGTVTDQVTGLVWLQQVRCNEIPGTDGSNLTDWVTARNGVDVLQDGLCGLTDGSQPSDWRLPTDSEWEATIGYARDVLLCPGGLQPVFSSTSGTACYNIVAPGHFLGLFAEEFWSSTVDDLATSQAFIADLDTGATAASLGKGGDNARAWPVRGRARQ